MFTKLEIKTEKIWEFSCAAAGWVSNIVNAVAQVTAVVQVWSLTQVLPYAEGAAKKITRISLLPFNINIFRKNNYVFLKEI